MAEYQNVRYIVIRDFYAYLYDTNNNLITAPIYFKKLKCKNYIPTKYYFTSYYAPSGGITLTATAQKVSQITPKNPITVSFDEENKILTIG